MTIDEGYVKFPRKMTKCKWYNDWPTYHLFTQLMFSASWKNELWQGITIKRGQRLCSLQGLAKETELSIQQIRTAISKLKSAGEITELVTRKYRIITLINYEKYQASTYTSTDEQQANQQKNQQADNRLLFQPSCGNQAIANKKSTDKSTRTPTPYEEDKTISSSNIIHAIELFETDDIEKLKTLKDALDEGIISISDKEFRNLLNILTKEELCHYYDVVKEQIKKGHRYKKSHYNAILDMVSHDRMLRGEA